MKKLKRPGDICILESLQWLLDPISHRGEGRTYFLALAYVNIALRYPGEWIKFRDHHPTREADENLGHYIRRFVAEEFKKKDFEFKAHEFRAIP